jgi:hypothetical protein
VLPREHTYEVSSDEEVAYSERAIQTRQNRRHSEPHAATQATLGRVRGEWRLLCCAVLCCAVLFGIVAVLHAIVKCSVPLQYSVMLCGVLS